jgi:hypothetical protein
MVAVNLWSSKFISNRSPPSQRRSGRPYIGCGSWTAGGLGGKMVWSRVWSLEWFIAPEGKIQRLGSAEREPSRLLLDLYLFFPLFFFPFLILFPLCFIFYWDQGINKRCLREAEGWRNGGPGISQQQQYIRRTWDMPGRIEVICGKSNLGDLRGFYYRKPPVAPLIRSLVCAWLSSDWRRTKENKRSSLVQKIRGSRRYIVRIQHQKHSLRTA